MSEHFFITGGTGLVGTALLPRILASWPDCTVTVLIRADDEQTKEVRLRDIVARLRQEGIPHASERVSVLWGDVGVEDLGLRSEQREDIIRTATHLIHGAATTRFDHPLEEARAINCGGTMRMIRLAQESVDRGRLKRMVYIGSSSVSGQRGGDIYEHELEMGQPFFNTYEHSKNESERLVRDYFDRVPATVFRPSIIIGDSRTGWTSSFNVIYIPLRLLHKGLLKYVPGTPSTKMDLVPIDWVSASMVHIMKNDESVGKVFHQTAGPKRAATLGEVVLSAIEYFDRNAPLSSPRAMEFIDRVEYERRRAVMRGREEALMSQLDTLLPYVSVDRLFDSRNSDALMEGSGIVFPLFRDYAERIFAFCLKTNWGKVGIAA
ncbi:MAG: SDR family oxidoreductase [Ignavibacteria bacterium]|nr:SDR family oxidoreductase [Ignavibacteria bacterium]